MFSVIRSDIVELSVYVIVILVPSFFHSVFGKPSLLQKFLPNVRLTLSSGQYISAVPFPNGSNLLAGVIIVCTGFLHNSAGPYPLSQID